MKRILFDLSEVTELQDGSTSPRRAWQVSAALALTALHAVLAWWARAPGVETGQDDATYLALARSLTQGGYNDLFLVGSPVHSQYPPGYPALLALVGGVFGEHADTYILTGILLSALALFLCWWALAERWQPGLSLVFLAVLAVNPYLIEHAGLIRSEAMYLLFSMVALVLVARNPTSRRSMFLAGAAAIIAALTRSVGLALLAAIGLHWILERRLAAVFGLAAGSAATVGVWLAWTVAAPPKVVGKSYIADALIQSDRPASFLLHLAGRVMEAARVYLPTVLPFRLPMPTVSGTPIDNVVGALIVAVGLSVGLGLVWRRWRVAALYLLAYAAVLALWPWKTGRFLIPILPIVVPATLLGFGAAVGRFRPNWRSPVVLVFALTLFLNGAWRTGVLARSWVDCDRSAYPFPPSQACLAPDQVSFFGAVEFIRDSLPEDARFLAVKAEPLWYYSGRRSVFYPNALRTSEAGFLPYLRSEGVDWILLGSLQVSEPKRLAELVEENCADLRLVGTFPPRTYLFELRRDSGAAGEDLGACQAVADYVEANVGRDFKTE